MCRVCLGLLPLSCLARLRSLLPCKAQPCSSQPEPSQQLKVEMSLKLPACLDFCFTCRERRVTRSVTVDNGSVLRAPVCLLLLSQTWQASGNCEVHEPAACAALQFKTPTNWHLCHLWQCSPRMHAQSQHLQSHSHSRTESCSSWGRPCRRSVLTPVGTNPSHHRQQHNNRQCCQAQKYDLIGLSNLCVDVVVSVDSLPGKDEQKRLQLLHQVSWPTSPASAEHLCKWQLLCHHT